MFFAEDYQELEGLKIGNFIIEEYITHGGQAVIYKSRSAVSHFKGKFALKIFGLSSQGTKADIEAAKIDLMISSSIKNASVMKYENPFEELIDFKGKTREAFCIPMEYTELGSCDQESPFKDKNGKLDEEDYKAIVNLLDGLGELHDKQIRHQDIKPANILKFLVKQNKKEFIRLVITDFGISKMYSAFAMGFEGNGGVTPLYMAPEQLDSDPTSEIDIYSMGATLFLMVTGISPIKEPTTQSDIHLWQEAHRTQPRQNPRDIATECHPRLALLIMRMMSVAPEDRPSVEECINEIEKIVEIERDKKLYHHKPSKEFEEALKQSNSLPIFHTADFTGVFKPEIHTRCKSTYFIFQIEMEHPVFDQYRTLIELLVSYFSESFSLYETWGQRDAFIMLWSDFSTVEEFKKAFKSRFYKSDIFIQTASEIRHFPTREFNPISSPHLVYALAIQENKKVEGLTDEIKEDYVYRYFPEEVPQDSVRAFTFVEPSDIGKAEELSPLIVAKVNETIEKLVMNMDPKDNERCIRKARVVEFDLKAKFEFLQTTKENKICVVDFVAKNYRYLVDVPTRIIEEIGDKAVKTTTFLETRRVVFQSDKILF